jgi:type I restriction enzyme M protein
MNDKITIRREKGKIWSHIRKKWLDETPEETVRQEFLCVLVDEYGFSLNQMDEEAEVTGRGSGHARADFVIWRAAKEKSDSKNPLIIVECKSNNVTIKPDDYGQGDNYARLTGARFFVTHNSRETKFWRVVHEKMPKSLEEIGNIPHADASDKQIEELIAKLKTFKEDEFADLLHQCHNVIRNREKLDPAAAFDEIAKILFVKVYVERELRAKRARKNLFSVDFLDEQLSKHPLNTLFAQTKDAYEDENIFDDDEEIRLKPATGREIVKLLERYNLSDTSEDIKGIAFERFLGRTFRGEIGQFFTPRSIVEFMIRMIEPKEGDIICDPASGSGGFLIRFFEIVREQILADADFQYEAFKAETEKKRLSETKKAEALRDKFAEIRATLDQRKPGSRLWKLANRCIFGTDANDRMARTSKMNMIMHGDGHAGVHHHDGFLNVNGIFEGRFDVILTNPPFGANVEPSDVVPEFDEVADRAAEKRYIEEYGELYTQAVSTVRAAAGKPIASLFELPKDANNKVKTEILFIERCLSLLKPGGRLAIVLPEGIFNNSSSAYVREFCEARSFVRAVVSLPPTTFFSSGAAVKASLLFLQKYSDKEKEVFDETRAKATAEMELKHTDEIESETIRLVKAIAAAPSKKGMEVRKPLQRELAEFRKRKSEEIVNEAWRLLKSRFSYPIFLYDSAKVGITATGDEDSNDLCRFPKDNLPAGDSRSCLELYQDFRNSKPVASPRVHIAPWSLTDRWTTPRALLAAERLPKGWRLARVGDFVTQVTERIRVEAGKEYRMAGVKWYGEGVFHRETVLGENMSATYVTPLAPAALIYNRLFAWKASFAVIPPELSGCFVSSEFPQFRVDKTKVLPDYLYLFFTLDSTLQAVNSASVGSSAVSRNRFKEVEFVSFEIPLPPVAEQLHIVRQWKAAQKAIVEAQQKADRIAKDIKAGMESSIASLRSI